MLFPGTTTTDEVVLVIERSADGATSSFVIVPWPWESAIVAVVDTLLRFTKKVSSDSTVGSPLMVTEIVFVVSPGLKVSVPLVAT